MTRPQRVRITGSMYRPQVPDGAVKVCHPTRWGNPHPMGRFCRACGGAVHGTRRTCVRLYVRDLLADPDKLERPAGSWPAATSRAGAPSTGPVTPTRSSSW